MELAWIVTLVVLLHLSHLVPPCICTAAVFSRHPHFSPRIKDGAFHFPVFHRKHPWLDDASSVHAASVSDAGTVVGNDDIHRGRYFMGISLGTPVVFNLVTIDTGSTLSWVQCEPCQISCHSQAPEAGPRFDPRNSTTYSHVGCSEDDCVAVHEANGIPFGCVEETDTCLYRVGYGRSSSSQYSVGRLGRDRIALGGGGSSSAIIIDEFVFGCSEDDRFWGSEAGVIGLGNRTYSFFNQLVRQTSYRAFAYCFPSDHTSEGLLTIGPYPPKLEEVATPLIVGYGKRWYPHAYSLLPLGIAVDGTPLDVDQSVYMRQLMIVDSGTNDTYLAPQIYDAFDKAMAAAMRDKGYVREYDDASKMACFRSASGAVDWSGLPKVEMRFLGAALTLPPQNVFHEQQLTARICLAFQPNAPDIEDMQVLGNKATRSFRVVYDLQMMTFRFHSRAC